MFREEKGNGRGALVFFTVTTWPWHGQAVALDSDFFRSPIAAFPWTNPSSVCLSNTATADYNEMNEISTAGHRILAIPSAWIQWNIWMKLAAFPQPGLRGSTKTPFVPHDKGDAHRDFLINKVFPANLLLGLRSLGIWFASGHLSSAGMLQVGEKSKWDNMDD